MVALEARKHSCFYRIVSQCEDHMYGLPLDGQRRCNGMYEGSAGGLQAGSTPSLGKHH